MTEIKAIPTRQVLAGVGLVLIFCVPRLLMLRESAYYDEHWTMLEMDAPNLSEYWERQSVSDPPSTLVPVYFTAQYLWGQVFSSNLLSARILSWLLSALTAVCFFFVGRRLIGSSATWIAVLLYGASMAHINYSVEVRMYPMTLLLAMLSMLTYSRLLEETTWPRLGVHVLVNVLLTGTHLMATPLFLVQWVYLLYARREHYLALKLWTTSHLGVLAGLLIWLRSVWSDSISDVALWITQPAVNDFVVAFLTYSGGRPTNWAIGEYLPFGISFDLVLLAGYFGLASFALLRREKSNILLALWTILPPVFLFVASYALEPIFLYRYSLYASFGLILLVARGIANVRSDGIRRVVIGLFVAMHLFQMCVILHDIRPRYRQAAQEIQHSFNEGDVVLGYKHYNADGLEYNNLQANLDAETVSNWDELIVAVGNATERGAVVWVCFWRWDRLSEFEQALDMMNLEFSEEEYGGVPRMTLYRIYPSESD